MEANKTTMELTLAYAWDLVVTLNNKEKTTFVASAQSHNNKDITRSSLSTNKEHLDAGYAKHI